MNLFAGLVYFLQDKWNSRGATDYPPLSVLFCRITEKKLPARLYPKQHPLHKFWIKYRFCLKETTMKSLFQIRLTSLGKGISGKEILMKNLGGMFSRNQCLRVQTGNTNEERGECWRAGIKGLRCLQSTPSPGEMSTSRDIWSTGLAKPSHLLAGLGPWATFVEPLD